MIWLPGLFVAVLALTVLSMVLWGSWRSAERRAAMWESLAEARQNTSVMASAVTGRHFRRGA